MIAVIDTETTGIDPAMNSLVEFAVVWVDPNKKQIVDLFSSLVKPRHLISVGAMATHHLRERDVENAPSWTEVALTASQQKHNSVAYAAHYTGFDSGFLPGLGPWICTWRLAQHLWPDAPGYSNQTLRYWLPGVDDEVRSHVINGVTDKYRDHPSDLPPHRALPDAWVTAHVVLRMLDLKSVDELVALSPQPILQKTCRFGKHAGEPWDKVPKDYLRWMISKGDFDPDVKHTARHHLGQV